MTGRRWARLTERGRRLASRREDLIATGVDPAELAVPVAPAPEPPSRAAQAWAWVRAHGAGLIGTAAVLMAGYYVWAIHDLKEQAAADRARQEASEARQAQSEAREACQARYNEAVVGQIKARAAVTEQRDQAEARGDDATDALLSGFASLALSAPVDGVRTPEQEAADRQRSLELFAGYQTARADVAAARAAVVKVRAENPLPDVPNCPAPPAPAPEE